MQIFNGTPVPVKARAEGVTYILLPGKVLDIEQPGRARTILDNYPALREVKFGDDLEEIAEESLADWCEQVEAEVRNYNQFQLEQAKQGLKLAPPHRQLEAFSKLVEMRTGVGLPLDSDEGQGDPLLASIRSLSMAIKRIKEDTPEKEKLSELLKELVKQKGDKHTLVEEKRQALLDDAALAKTGPVAAARARRRRPPAK